MNANPAPSINAHTDVLCHGGNNGSATVTVSGGTTNYSYSWNNGQTLATASNLGSGTYTVTVTDAHTCTSMALAVITQPAQWFPGLSGPGTVCQNSTGNLYQTESGMTSYVWVVSAGGTITNGGSSTDPSVTVTWNGSGPQTISVTYTNGSGCTSTTVYNVTVNPAPTPVISGANIVTQGQTVTYSTPYVSGHTYSWNVSHGNAMICFPLRNCITVIWDFPCGIINPGYVKVYETDPATGCSKKVTLLITITP